MSSFKDNTDYYGAVSRFNHWIAAVIIVGMLTVGLYFNDMPRGDEKSYWLSLHIGAGGLFFIYLLFRVFWRVFSKSPRPVEQKQVLQIATKVIHWLLLISILIMALTGPMLIWTRAVDINVFGWFSIPGPFVDKMPELHEWCEEIHEIVAKVLLFSILIHVFAALKHQFLDKDNTLARMIKTLRK
jgi:cytochrome b561